MSPPGPLKQSSQNPIFIQNLNFFTFFLDTKSNTSCASAALTQALRKCLIPPKRSLQSFLKLKKIGVSHQNRAIKKKKLQNWKNSNSHTHFSFFVSFHLYMIYRFGFSLPALLYWVMLFFFSKQIGCYFVCDSMHVIQEDGATIASTFFRFKAFLGLLARPQRWSYMLWVPRISFWS